MIYSIGNSKSFHHLAVKLACFFMAVGVSIPAFAHHPMGGLAPSNFFEGFLSGLAHPIIGLDHFAFLIAVGLLSVGLRYRASIPLLFVAATALGTTLHLNSFDLVLSEAIVAASVVIAGGLLVGYRRNKKPIILLLSGIAGVFHGYAYGEAVVGSETTPILAYLFGFSLIQFFAISLAGWGGDLLMKRLDIDVSKKISRFIGASISSVGFVFLGLAAVSW